MPNLLTAKQPGDAVRITRNGSDPAIEDGWVLVRFEPGSGNAVAEKDGKRVITERAAFDALNFPGSDELWEMLSAPELDAELLPVKAAWSKADLPGVVSALVKYARTLDPAFAGVQTASDMIEKAKEHEDSCQSSLEILRLDAARAKREYDQYPARTALENDHKDNLLTRWRNLDDQYAAHRYQCDRLIPAWRRTSSALKALTAFISTVTPA